MRAITKFTQGRTCLNIIGCKVAILNLSSLDLSILELLGKNSHLSWKISQHINIMHVTPLTRHPMSSEGVIFFYLFYFYKPITFKLVHSYNVKHLTCTIFYSSGLQNIYKLHIWKCSTFTIFTLFTKTKHIQK